MTEAYAKWIADYRGEIENRCATVTKEMLAVFPELRRAGGHVWGIPTMGDLRPHWWLVAPDGEIVDPTRGQWGEGYLEYEEMEKLPTGKCMECGAYAFDGEVWCSVRCAEALERAYGRDWTGRRA